MWRFRYEPPVFSELRRLHWWWRHLDRPHAEHRRQEFAEKIIEEKSRLVAAGVPAWQVARAARCLRQTIPCRRCASCLETVGRWSLKSAAKL
jgi:hypothetical protein